MSIEIRLGRIEKRLNMLESLDKATDVRGSEAFARRAVHAVASVTSVGVKVIRGDYKGPRVVSARYACACIMVEDGAMSNRDIGEAINRHHTTITGYRKGFQRIDVRDIVAKARGLMEDGA